ncbi:unnamed protein product [Brassicogethes aeneus]|uniref:Regulator of microtubule dynamics protein 1 n=1 Tax=Brassicogethes aeneus TaxID=1431903 RepID=A0A9P0AT35_BRAAE|nr:unnamed protein product [Brassicogethes aeneus]
MPITNNLNAFLGAAMLGVISAAGMFLVEHYRQERRRYEMAKDMARMDKELSIVKKDLQDLMNKKRERLLSFLPFVLPHRQYLTTNGGAAPPVRNSNVLHLKWGEGTFWGQKKKTQTVSLYQVLADIDRKSNEEVVEELNSCLVKLQDLCLEHPGNAELLWRIGKCHYKLLEKSEDKEFIQQQLKKGLDACTKALELAPDSGDAHKWTAILIGARSDYVPMKERIADSHLFKLHVDMALRHLPNDSTLHHMLGRFSYEVAGLKWYERKVASTLFATPPNATFEEALEHFMECEKLSNHDWKENKLFVAKCKVAQGEYKEAVTWLDEAKACKQGDCMDDKIDKEVNALLAKYNSYR